MIVDVGEEVKEAINDEDEEDEEEDEARDAVQMGGRKREGESKRERERVRVRTEDEGEGGRSEDNEQVLYFLRQFGQQTNMTRTSCTRPLHGSYTHIFDTN